jgi:two-component system response regulator
MLVILAVDDEEDAHLLLKRAFHKAALDIPLIGFRNGAQAIEYLGAEGQFCNRTDHPFPSLLLLDLKMPIKDGFDVLEFIKQKKELQKFPVIVFSCSAERSDVAKAYALGCHAYVQKPVESNELNALVKAIGQEFFPSAMRELDDKQPAKPFSAFVVTPEKVGATLPTIL